MLKLAVIFRCEKGLLFKIDSLKKGNRDILDLVSKGENTVMLCKGSLASCSED